MRLERALFFILIAAIPAFSLPHKHLWIQKSAGIVNSAQFGDRGDVFVGTECGSVAQFTKDGNFGWRQSLREPVQRVVRLDDVLIAQTSSMMYAFRIKDGALLWDDVVPDGTELIATEEYLITLEDTHTVARVPRTGDAAWSLDLPGPSVAGVWDTERRALIVAVQSNGAPCPAACRVPAGPGLLVIDVHGTCLHTGAADLPTGPWDRAAVLLGPTASPRSGALVVAADGAVHAAPWELGGAFHVASACRASLESHGTPARLLHASWERPDAVALLVQSPRSAAALTLSRSTSGQWSLLPGQSPAWAPEAAPLDSALRAVSALEHADGEARFALWRTDPTTGVSTSEQLTCPLPTAAPGAFGAVLRAWAAPASSVSPSERALVQCADGTLALARSPGKKRGWARHEALGHTTALTFGPPGEEAQRLYAGTRTGRIFAFDSEGAVLWTQWLPQHAQTGSEDRYWLFAPSAEMIVLASSHGPTGSVSVLESGSVTTSVPVAVRHCALLPPVATPAGPRQWVVTVDAASAMHAFPNTPESLRLFDATWGARGAVFPMPWPGQALHGLVPHGDTRAAETAGRLPMHDAWVYALGDHESLCAASLPDYAPPCPVATRTVAADPAAQRRPATLEAAGVPPALDPLVSVLANIISPPKKTREEPRYTRRNLAIFATHKPAASPKQVPSVHIHVVDGATGRAFLKRSIRPAVGPVLLSTYESDVHVAYYNPKLRRHDLVVLSLANATKGDTPRVTQQTFALPSRPVALTPTMSRMGATPRSLVVAFADGQVLEYNAQLVNPRRPVSAPGKPSGIMGILSRMGPGAAAASAGASATGLPLYTPVLPAEARQILTGSLAIPRLAHLATAPGTLESTSLVAAGGVDLLLTTAAPLGAFDSLPRDFPAWLLGVVLAVLAALNVALLGVHLYRRTQRAPEGHLRSD